MKKFRMMIAVMTLVGVAALAGCGGSKPTAAPAGDKVTSPSATEAPKPPRAKVRIIVGGIDKIIYLPAMLTQQLGYFEEQNLEVQLSNVTGGQIAEEALIAGEVEGVVGFYDHTIDMQSKGKKLIDVVMFDQAPGEALVVSKKALDRIKSIQDLKGANIGVTSLGSSTQFLATYLVVRGGNRPSDFRPIAVGAGQTFVTAMQQGKIDAGVTTEPTISLILKNGDGVVLVDMRDMKNTSTALGGSYPAASLYMSADYVAKNPEVVQRVANAFVKTLRFISTHSAEEIADKMPKDFYAGDKDLYVAALKASLPMFSPTGKMPPDGPATVLSVLSTFDKNIQPAKIDLGATFTDTFVDKAKQ